MIGRLRGVVAEVTEEEALIEVAGVGYVVRCGARTLARLPPPGDETVVHVESQWTEGAGQRLYGFLVRDERQAFVLLQQIQGVGPKAALAVLDVLPPADLAAAVAREDRAAISRASGVGPKLAARILVELRNKPIMGGPFAVASTASPPVVAPSGAAVAALMGLGWAEPVARRTVEQAAARLDDGADEAALIRAALRELGQ